MFDISNLNYTPIIGWIIKLHRGFMKISKLLLVVLMILVLMVSFACQNREAEKETNKVEDVEKGEESGSELALNEKYDMIRNGARLILIYEAESKSFVGTVENTTDKLLEKVRIEVHLSNGIELGPTAPTDLAAGKKMNIKLTTKSEGFDGWTAHPEVGGEKGEHGGERGEHYREGGEHNENGGDEH
jgi:type III secretory pathway component EscV